ncbi:MAG: response regulator transcription factor [Acidobacteriota bacterium]|nr:MAG: response regulator transcription factor [Acidobacteriota bacterium]
MPTQVLIIESQPLVRVGIGAILANESDIEVIGEAGTAGEGFTLFTTRRPDVVLLSLRMPDSCAIDDLGSYFKEDAKAKIIILAERPGDAEISRALKQGATGYVTKDIEPELLIEAIRRVAAGGKFIPANVAGVLSENLGSEELTPAESNVLRMIVGGMSNKEIAFALDLSENTIKSHVSNIFDKMGVSDRTTAATTAIKRGLVRVDI